MIVEKTRSVLFALREQQFTTCWRSPAARWAVGEWEWEWGWVGGGFDSDRPEVVGFRGRRRQANNWPDLLPWAQLYAAVPRATKVLRHSLHSRRDGFEQARRPHFIHYVGVKGFYNILWKIY